MLFAVHFNAFRQCQIVYLFLWQCMFALSLSLSVCVCTVKSTGSHENRSVCGQSCTPTDINK